MADVHKYDPKKYKYVSVGNNFCFFYERSTSYNASYFLHIKCATIDAGNKALEALRNDPKFKDSIVPARIQQYKNKPIIAWKKCYKVIENVHGQPAKSECVLVKLEIPKRAKRFQPKNYKCRASSAKVLGIYSMKGHKLSSNVVACAKLTHGSNLFLYKVGKSVKPTLPFSTNELYECKSGIHFFLTKEEAKRYNL